MATEPRDAEVTIDRVYANAQAVEDFASGEPGIVTTPAGQQYKNLPQLESEFSAALVSSEQSATDAATALSSAEQSATDAQTAKDLAQTAANEAQAALDTIPSFDARIMTIENLGLVEGAVEVGGLPDNFDLSTYRSGLSSSKIYVYNDPFDESGIANEIELDAENAGTFNAYIYDKSDTNVFSVDQKLTFTAVTGRNYFAISSYVKAGQYFGVSGSAGVLYLVNGTYAPLLYQFTGEGDQSNPSASLNTKIPAKIKIQTYKNALSDTVAALQTTTENQATTLNSQSLQLTELAAAIAELQAGGTGTVTSPWRVINQRSNIHNSTDSNSARDRYIFNIQRKIGGGDVKELSVAFDTAYLSSSSTGLLTNIGNDLVFEKVAIEHAGISVPLTKSGARGFTIEDGTFDYRLDSILPSAFGLETFAHGSSFQIKGKILLPASNKAPSGVNDTRSMTDGLVAFYNSADTTVSDVDTLGAFTSSGTALFSRIVGIEPRLIGKYVNDAAATVLGGRGDSITAGTGDTSRTNPTGKGWLNRMAGGYFTQAPALFNMAVHGSTSLAGKNDARLTPIYSMITDGLISYGANDLGIDGLGDHVALQNRVVEITQQMKDAGVRSVGVMKLLPRTTSTDLWATEANQTYSGQWQAGGNPDLYNQSLPLSNTDYVLLMDSMRGVDPWKTVVDGTARYASFDGTHPSIGGYLLMADESAQDCAAAIPNLTAV